MLFSRIEHYATSLYAVVSSEWSTDSVDIGWQRSSGQRHRLSQRHHCFTPDPTTTTGASTVVHHYSIWVVSSDLCYEQHAYKSCRRKMNGICASSVDLGIVVLFGWPLPWNLVVDTWIIHVFVILSTAVVYNNVRSLKVYQFKPRKSLKRMSSWESNVSVHFRTTWCTLNCTMCISPCSKRRRTSLTAAKWNQCTTKVKILHQTIPSVVLSSHVSFGIILSYFIAYQPGGLQKATISFSPLIYMFPPT